MVAASGASKNIWVAASDGDLARVRSLIQQGMSPNIKDSNSYTPMHAAASYHHLPLLSYLISVGGDINLLDNDGETPLFTIESIETAEWMLAHGADPNIRNGEGQSAADFIEDDHPDVAAYLRSKMDGAVSAGPPSVVEGGGLPEGQQIRTVPESEMAVEGFADDQTSQLLEDTQRIMAQAERDGTNPDEQLREVVERAVRQGFTYGGQIGQNVQQGGQDVEPADGDDRKRTRLEDNQ